MNHRLIQPGRSAAVHPRTGAVLEPVYVTKTGRVVWPQMGAAPDPDDPDDPDFTGEDDEDDDSSEEDADKDKKNKKDDEDEDDTEKPVYTQAEYDRLRKRMRAADSRASDFQKRLEALEKGGKDKSTKDDAESSKEIGELKSTVDKLTKQNRALALENAFHAVNSVDWVDTDDVMAALERLDLLDDVIEDDGTVDRKAFRRVLRELAKRKPHLVKKSQRDDHEDDDDDGETPPVATRRANGKRKGSSRVTDRAALAKRFPALGR